MTLTVVVGCSGSGKTTFLNDVYKSHKCTYIRQYHMMRPYITVSKIPNFDPTQLPYWDIYKEEGTADTIKVGGTMAGETTAGLSGGQRKLLLFELIRQRTADQTDLLIELDEPFAGVTADFVPYLVECLNEMRQTHNILLVTNDHVDTLTEMADNTITVSAINRSCVKINEMDEIDREKAIHALSLGNSYTFTSTGEDLKFFVDVEVLSSKALVGIALFSIACFSLFTATFYGSNEASAALVLIAGEIITFFCVNPYLLSLVDWRNAQLEEAEALMHASKGMNKTLKALLTLSIILILSLVEFGTVNVVIDGLSDVKFWVAMLFDDVSLMVPLFLLGLYTRLPFQAVQILGTLPFLGMIFFSTTYSPGSGITALKELRYLFPRFYFWCMLPEVDELMEGCPDEDMNMLYLILSGLSGPVFFLVAMAISKIQARWKEKGVQTQRTSLADKEFFSLQIELYGMEAFRRNSSIQLTQHSGISLFSRKKTHHLLYEDSSDTSENNNELSDSV